MLWVFVSQMLLVVALFVWNDFFPPWLNQVIVVSVILLSPLAYLTVLAKPVMRHAWRETLRDTWSLIISITRACGRLFLPSTFMKLVRFIASLEPVPTTIDGWITLCVLPFKTCVAATFPVVWIFEKVLSYTSYYRPYGRVFGLSYDLIFQFYLISLLALLFGAVIQGIFCHTGRATVTLRFFLLGLALIFFAATSSAIRI
jgi:hypothetical protein